MKNDHRNIVKVLDYGRYDTEKFSSLFYVMPYYECNLRQLIEHNLSGSDIIEIFKQLLLGLEFAHKKGVYHRDLKPENILCNSDGIDLVIADWGIAHFCKEEKFTNIETKSTSRLANFKYASPEQKEKKQMVTERSDIYSLGLILNEMFTQEVIGGTNYKTISDVNADFGYLDLLITKLIEQEPNNRLYPINKIFIELSVLMKKHHDKVMAQQLINEKIEAEDSEDPLFHVELKNLVYKNGILELHLDKVTNLKWNMLFTSGMCAHHSLLNYPVSIFQYKAIGNDHTVYTVRILKTDEYQSIMTHIVDYFKEWVEATSIAYKSYVERERELEFERAVKEREETLNRLKKEAEINDVLKDLV